MVDSEIIFLFGISALGVLSIAYVLFGFSISSNSFNKNKINIRGLKNSKNDCFINSILQSLASSRSMIEWLQKVNLKKLKKSKETNLIFQLSTIVNKINNNNQIDSRNNNDILTPDGVYDSLRKHRWIFSNDEQDAFELFSVLISTLETEFNQLSFALSVRNSFSNNSDLLSNNRTKPFFSRINDGNGNVNGIQEIPSRIKNSLPTRGISSNHLTCKNCNRNYPIKLDVFDSISLSLPSDINITSSIKLEDCLEKFISTEEIENFKCDYCKKESTFTKKIELIKLPQLLCFHVQRLIWSNGKQPFKRIDHVKFPKILNMDPFKHKFNKTNSHNNQKQLNGMVVKNYDDDGGDNDEENSQQSDMQSSESSSTSSPANNTYSLNSIIVHLGNDNSGHFICYRSLMDKRSNKTKWFYTSDLFVKEVSETEVLSSCAYMLFYEKNHQSNLHQQQLDHELNSNLKSS